MQQHLTLGNCAQMYMNECYNSANPTEKQKEDILFIENINRIMRENYQKAVDKYNKLPFWKKWFTENPADSE